ncbi:MAG: stage II sporulation protein D [Oscillospiraceae bacterium]|nr:stage II sporulation protein D [Oscillospiraceae bacterium]
MGFKRVAAVSLLLAALAFSLPLMAAPERPEATEPKIEAPEETGARSAPAAEKKPKAEDRPDSLPGEDAAVMVRLLVNGETKELTLAEYLAGVVAAEMPAAFEDEALKAQCVAARTYTLYRMLLHPSPEHPEADMCANVQCCQAYISPDERRERWKAAFEENEKKIERAVALTDGQCLVWEGEPIFAAFHSSSGGFTEDSGSVWHSSLPYLVSVYSPETEECVPNFRTETEISFSDFKSTVSAKYPQAAFGGEPSGWIGGIERSLSGRITRAEIGGVSLTGTELRMLFSLRSADIEISETESGFVFYVTGYGHGVGMSQYGAETLAAAGSSYKQILEWYYTGAELRDMKEFLP